TVWFNHAYFFNVFSLDAEVRNHLIAHGRMEDLPFQTFYGDGSPIERDVIEAIGSAIESETHVQPWQKGDVLLLDNMLRAHGRMPYVGSRVVAVAMTEIYDSRGATV